MALGGGRDTVSAHRDPAFGRYIGVDYSGAETPDSSLKGLRVYLAEADSPPREVLPPPSPRKYWTRRGVAEWLLSALSEAQATIVGIDHGFSFPSDYFSQHGLPRDWDIFLKDFCAHWPTDEAGVYVDFVREGLRGNGAARLGNARWRRLTEVRSRGAKSVFHFDVQGSVAKSTHAGIPWLLFLRQHLLSKAHFWPFDGCTPTPGQSVVAEVYPALWSRAFPIDERDGHQQDAFCTAAWLQRADRRGDLDRAFHPKLSSAEAAIAAFEGWILDVA